MRIAVYLVILLLLVLNSFLYGWNKGSEVGYKAGRDTTILSGAVRIECKFPRNPNKCLPR